MSSQSIRCLTKDTQGTIWIGTYYGGINYFNPDPEVFQYFDFKKSQSDFLYPIVGKIIEDIRGDFWICSDGKGLIYYNKKETLILKSEKTIHFSNGEILGITQEMSDKIREAILDNMTNLLCVSNEKGKTIHIINLKEVSFIS